MTIFVLLTLYVIYFYKLYFIIIYLKNVNLKLNEMDVLLDKVL